MFDARLVNPPSGDPALLVKLPEGLHFLFDCGSLHTLPNSELLKVRRVFITHTHIDHAIGLDHLMRVQLYSKTPLDIYGPPGVLQQLSGRLRGYAWNLIADSPYAVGLHEIHPYHVDSRLLQCRTQFAPERLRRRRHQGVLELPEGFSLRWVELFHGVACLGYRLDGKPFLRFQAERARQMGLQSGPWISQLKQLVVEKAWRRRLRAVSRDGGRDPVRTVAEWKSELLSEEPPPTIAYITDTLLESEQRARLIPFLRGCQELWCEATYCEADAAKARLNLHATASQAGYLAREAAVERLSLFHLSRRYQADSSVHLREAQQVFPQARMG